MRPTPAEILSGIRRIMENVIIPDIRSEYAKVPAGSIVMALAQLEARWDSMYPTLLEENDRLRTLFEDISAGLAELLRGQIDGDMQAFGRRLQEVAGLSGDGAARYPTFSLLQQQNTRYNEVLVEVIEALEAAADLRGDDPVLTDMRQRVRAHLRWYLDKETGVSMPRPAAAALIPARA